MSEREYITIDEADCDEVIVLDRDNDRHRSEKRRRHRSRSGSRNHRQSSRHTPIMTVHFASRHIQNRYHRRVSALLSSLLDREMGEARCELDGDSLLVFCEDREHQRRSQHRSESVSLMSDGRPQYDVNISGVVGSNSGAQQEVAAGGRGSCFNCDGDHMLHECDQPRDLQRIAKNRRLHAARAPPQCARYHEETQDRWSDLKPGQLSKRLRRALGLSRHRVPAHVLRMRRLGYPPGWLDAAERCNDAKLRVLTGPSGPKAREERRRSRRYDGDKLVMFPGFNLESDDPAAEPGHLDYCERQSLLQMKRQLCDNSADSPRSSSSSPSVEVEAMSENGDEFDGEEREQQFDDMSLRQLHQRRQLLLATLSEPKDGESEPKDEESEPAPLAQSTPHPVRHCRPGAGDSLRVHLGTPVQFPAGTSNDSLPDVTKWAEGITQHLPYENLPGATGSWDRIRSLVDKVRARAKNSGDQVTADVSGEQCKVTKFSLDLTREDVGVTSRDGANTSEECNIEVLDCVDEDTVDERTEASSVNGRCAEDTSPSQGDNNCSDKATTPIEKATSEEEIHTVQEETGGVDGRTSPSEKICRTSGDKPAIETVDLSDDESCPAAEKTGGGGTERTNGASGEDAEVFTLD